MIRTAALIALLAGPAVAQGMVEVPAGGAPTPERGAAFVQVLRANGCAMSEDQAAQILPAAGFGKDEITAYLDPLLSGSHAMLDEAIRGLRLSDDLCKAAPDADAALFAAAVSPLEQDLADVRRLSDAALRARIGDQFTAAGCRIEMTDRAGVIGMLTAFQVAMLGLPEAAPGTPAHDEMARRIDQFLTNPGPLYTISADALTLIACKP